MQSKLTQLSQNTNIIDPVYSNSLDSVSTNEKGNRPNLESNKQYLAQKNQNPSPFLLQNSFSNREYQGKIVWNRISQELCFSYDNKGYMILDSMFMITCSNHIIIKYLLALLNSSLSKYWIKNNAATLGDGIYGAKIYIEKIPIPKIDSKNKDIALKIIALVDSILLAKRYKEDTSVLESHIDSLVYTMYCLDESEIKAITSKR